MAKSGDYSLPGLTPEDFYNHWLRYGVGGTCWAGHGALYALLKHLGFDVYPAISRMLSTPTPSSDSPGHGTLVVYLSGEPHIVDSTIYHGCPLPLIEKCTDHSVWGDKCTPYKWTLAH
ncbi:arylamine N-acetyltransferase [Salmonella enterica]